MDDWPTLGQAVHTFEKKKSVVITNGETAKQNGTTQEKAGSHEDSDESQSSQINNQDTRTKKGWSPWKSTFYLGISVSLFFHCLKTANQYRTLRRCHISGPLHLLVIFIKQHVSYVSN